MKEAALLKELAACQQRERTLEVRIFDFVSCPVMHPMCTLNALMHC